MAQTLCIKCGSETKVSSYCQLCQEPLIFACSSCDYITEEKVHSDCRNAEMLAKTTTEEGAAAATTPTPTTGKKEESIVDKPKEETVKAEPRSAPSYMTREQDKENSNDLNSPNPFVTGTAVWQSLLTYWFNAYGEFLKNAPKMTEYWYDVFWKPWLNWARQQQVQDKYRVKIE
jgi:hypothetical protein